MAFKITDFKKTTRKAGDARVLYPYQIRDDRYTAAISYTVAYFERMVGRRRADFETDALLEFFGDPRLARGLVASLSRTYVWREQSFADAFGDETAQALWRAGLATPATLRRKLYGLANGCYNGFIATAERPAALAALCTDLPLTVAQFERGSSLDAEENQMLVKLGATPTPEEIIARYNYHSLETALCRAETLRLSLHGPVWDILRSVHNLARRYRLRYNVGDAPRTLFDDQLELVLHGGRDALGRHTRTGRRLVRALLRLLAVHPNSIDSGEAVVHLGTQRVTLRLDARALRVLGVAAQEKAPESEAWEADAVEDFRKYWSRAMLRGHTDGWRIRRDPEPLIHTATVVVPDFVLQRGNQRLALCLANGQAMTEALLRDLGQLGRQTPAVVVLPDHIAIALKRCSVPIVTYSEQPTEAIQQLVATLERTYPRSMQAAQTPWQQLDQRVDAEKFVSEETVAAILGCQANEALQLVQRWGGTDLHVLPGIGVCTGEMLGDIRALLEQGVLQERAA